MGDFRKKKNKLLTDLEGKKILKGNTWGKKSCTEKNVSLMVYYAEKNILHCYISGEKFYLQRFGKKIHHKSPISPSKVKWLAPKGEMAKR